MAMKSRGRRVALVVGVEKFTDKVGPGVDEALATTGDSDFEAVQGMTATGQAALLMRRYMHENGVPAEAALHQDPRVVARIQRSVDALNAKLPSYSTVKRFAILPKDFTQEAGELTPTLKVKRKLVSQRYQELLDSFYAE